MIRLYGIRSCDTCRRALKWLRSHDVAHTFIDVRETGLDKSLVARWQKSVNWQELLNRRSATWRNIPAGERGDLNPSRAGDLIIEYPTLMKRPLLEISDHGDDRVVLGYNETKYASLDL